MNEKYEQKHIVTQYTTGLNLLSLKLLRSQNRIYSESRHVSDFQFIRLMDAAFPHRARRLR
jgi:hypothetical protein